MQIQFVCQVRDNKKLGRKEYFTYDGLNRLEYSHFGAAPTPTAYTMKMSYDANGNIASKIMHSSISPVPLAHLSTYSYQDTGILGKNYPVAPHAVSSAGGETYVYDAFGQVISGAGRSVQWTSYNKPDYIADSASRSFFDYGAGRARYQQLQESWNTGLAAWEFKRKINYHGSHFEQEILNPAGTQTKELHYILTPTGRSLTVETTNENLSSKEYRYLHQDHLSSVDVVTDESGVVVTDDENSPDGLDLNYDPWGLRRDDQMEDTTGYRKSSQRRGFTDHEHLDDLGLIHMTQRKCAKMAQPIRGVILQTVVIDTFRDDVATPYPDPESGEYYDYHINMVPGPDSENEVYNFDTQSFEPGLRWCPVERMVSCDFRMHRKIQRQLIAMANFDLKHILSIEQIIRRLEPFIGDTPIRHLAILYFL